MPKIITQKDFIENVKLIHGENIDFTDAVYVKDNIEVKCKCNICGYAWEAKPQKLKIGHGCPICGHKKAWKNRKNRTTTNAIIDRMKKIFPNYDFSKNTEITAQKQKIIVCCEKHGEFKTTPDAILHKHGCRKCQYEKLKEEFSYKQDEIVEMSKNVHGDEYSYDNSIYLGIDVPMEIFCKKHGYFTQTPYKHINCKHGCPTCKQSKLEREVSDYLTQKNIDHENGKKFDWLGMQHLDFYLPKYNIAIECQGEQHYEAKSFNHDKSEITLTRNFEYQQERDQRKKKLCEENGVKLLCFTHYDKVDEDDTTFKDKDKLLEKITSYELRI